MFEKDFHPDSGHAIFKKPPKLESDKTFRKQPRDWKNCECLSHDQWSKLIAWCEDWFEQLTSVTPAMRSNLAKFGRPARDRTGQRLIGEWEIAPCGSVTAAKLNEATLKEAWRQATKRRSGSGEVDA